MTESVRNLRINFVLRHPVYDGNRLSDIVKGERPTALFSLTLKIMDPASTKPSLKESLIIVWVGSWFYQRTGITQTSIQVYLQKGQWGNSAK